MEGKVKNNLFSVSLIRYFFVLAAVFALSLSACRPGKEAAKPLVPLSQDVKETITSTLASMKGPVVLHFYHGGAGATSEMETRAVLDFMAQAAPQISVVDHTLKTGDEKPAGSFPGVAHGPVIRIEGGNRGSLVYYGYPEHMELQPFLEGVLLASGKQAGLTADAESFLSKLDQNVRILVFTTPD